MTRINSLQHKFVDYIPEALDDGVLYVSIPFATVVHRCCCGCGSEVVTPLDPTDWEMIFDGKSVSLCPSIGNWRLVCQSHYWIRYNQVMWIRHLSEDEIEEGRARDRFEKAQQYDGVPSLLPRKPFWRFLSRWLMRRTKRSRDVRQ